MPAPYDLYIRFLITTGVDDLKDVNSRLAELNLGEVSKENLAAQHALIESSAPQGIKSQIESKIYSADFLQWMRILEVEELWWFDERFRKSHKDQRPLIKLVYDIHQDPQIRLTINALLMKAVSNQEIMQALVARYSTLLKEEHIRIYKKFFFDPNRMTRQGWNAFIRQADEKEMAIYFAALSEPLDVLKAELELPSKISASETLQYLAIKSFQRAKQYLGLNTPEANKEAREWIDTTIKLTEKYEKYKASDMEDFAQQLQLAFEFVDTDFAVPDSETLAELAAKAKKDQEKGSKKKGGDGG